MKERIFLIVKMIVLALVCTIIANFLFGEIMELINLPNPTWVNFILSIGFFLAVLSSILFVAVNNEEGQENSSAI